MRDINSKLREIYHHTSQMSSLKAILETWLNDAVRNFAICVIPVITPYFLVNVNINLTRSDRVCLAIGSSLVLLIASQRPLYFQYLAGTDIGRAKFKFYHFFCYISLQSSKAVLQIYLI